MKKLITTIFAIGLFLPVVAEARFSPEGVNRPKKSRCKGSGGVTVCRMPRKPKKCSLKRPCIPKGYYRKNPPKFIPMG